MSSKQIIVFIVIAMSSVAKLITEEEIRVDRICKEEKDYVDASVILEDGFLVIVDDLYYHFIYDYPPFSYKAEGIQEIELKEYDESWYTKTGEHSVQSK